MPEPTKLKLATVLRAAGLESLADRAATGEFSDFESSHIFPKVELIQELAKIHNNYSLTSAVMQSAHRIACDVKKGKYDDTAEEAEAWAKNPKL